MDVAGLRLREISMHFLQMMNHIHRSKEINAVLHGIYERMKVSGFDTAESSSLEDEEVSKDDVYVAIVKD